MIQDLFDDLDEEEKKRKKELLEGSDDRKSCYNDQQIDKYFEFKDIMKAKLGEQLANQFSDNVYCRYLTGYVWDLKIAEEKMTGMAVNQSSLKNIFLTFSRNGLQHKNSLNKTCSKTSGL